MNVRLDPVTLYKLQTFAKRRNRLIAVRGGCAFVATALVAMSIVAFVDFFLVLPDWARITLSLAAYALALSVLYTTALRWLLRTADLRQLARMFEADHKELKEKVLSAVELGRPPKKELQDSEQLRAIFQKRVASLIKAYKLKTILPTSKILRWPVIAFVVVLFCIALTVIPKLKYAQLMARAFAPTANIARVSALSIEIAEPTNPEPTVPRGDPVTIVAKLSDESKRDVFLESSAPDGEPMIVKMDPVGRTRYSATVLVARESLTYRVFAAKASTREYTILSRRRPHVTKFHKTYHYPRYSRLEDKQVVETTGDIEAIQSSSVDLSIEVDQPVAAGHMQLRIGENEQTIKLTSVQPKVLSGKVDILESGTYRVHLVAEETKFENKFAPNYEIVALADLVPDVSLVKPESNVIMPPDSIVRLEGAAKDDLGLQTVEQWIRVNQSEWEIVTLIEEPSKEQVIKKSWDLLPLELQPGDQVSTKLVAIDLKAAVGESLVSQITISSPGFSARNLENSKQKKHLQESLVALAEGSSEFKKDVQALREIYANSPGDSTKLHDAQLKTQVSSEKTDALTEIAFKAIEDVMQGAETRIESEDMVLLGRMLSRLEHNEFATARTYAGLIERSQEPSKEHFDKAADAANRVEGAANHIRHAYSNILAHQQARNVLREVRRLESNQAEMLAQAQEDAASKDKEIRTNTWRRFVRRQKAAAREQQIIEEMLDDLSQYAEYNAARQARNVIEKLAEQRDKTQEALRRHEPGPGFAQQGVEAENRLREAADSLENTARSLRSRAANDRRGLTQSVALSADEVAQLKWKVEDFVRKQKTLTNLQGQANTDPERIEQQRTETIRAARLAENRWGSASGQLSDRADLEDIRRSGNRIFVADTAKTAAAIDKLHATATDPAQIEDSVKAVSEIEKAYRLLETGNNLIDTKSFLDEMTAREKWNFAQTDPFDQPLTQWDYWDKRARTLPNQLRDAGLGNEIRNEMNEAINSPPYKAVAAESRHRNSPENKRNPIAPQMQLLAQKLGDLSEQIEPQMEEARKIIAEYAPSLVDQLRAVSKLAKQAEEQTKELIEQADEQKPEETRADAAESLGRQQALNDHLDTIRDSLRRDANIQDLSREEGRQRARDADDATAMLRQPPPKAENLLAQAARSMQPDAQGRALEQAAQQQEKLSDALDLITEHYENLEAGYPEDTRLALRQTEQDSELGQNLDTRYDRLDELAQMLQTDPNQLKAMLEKELVQNMPMQEELGRIVDSTVQQAARGVEEMVNREDHISERLEKIAQKQDRDNPRLAPLNNKANELTKKAQQLAQRAKNLAENKVADAARRSNDVGAKAGDEFEKAKDYLKEGAESIPKTSTASPAKLAEKVENFAQDVENAKANLNSAADQTQAAANDQNREKANQAAQKAREARNEAQNIANEAKQLAAQLKDVTRQQDRAFEQVAQNPPQSKFAQRAKELAQQAGRLAESDIPQASQKAQAAGAKASENFESAAGAAGEAAEQMPTDFSEPAEALADQVDDFADSMEQAGKGLQSALGKVNAAPRGEGNQRSQAASRTRSAQQKAMDLKRQGEQLAGDLRNMDRRRSGEFENTDRSQQEINAMAPEVIDDIARAAIHAERLDRPESRRLQQTAMAMEGIAQNELPEAQDALDTASHARQAQAPVDQAYDALAGQLESFGQMQTNTAQAMQAPPSPPEDNELATWMARTLDSLEAAQLAQGNPQQAQTAATAQQTANQALQAQQNAMAQARAQSQAQAQQSRNAARNRMSSQFSSDMTSADMPPETGRELPENLRLLSGDWGKLRKLSAKDLMEARKETVSEDYREMVNTYFRVISQKARQKN